MRIVRPRTVARDTSTTPCRAISPRRSAPRDATRKSQRVRRDLGLARLLLSRHTTFLCFFCTPVPQLSQKFLKSSSPPTDTHDATSLGDLRQAPGGTLRDTETRAQVDLHARACARSRPEDPRPTSADAFEKSPQAISGLFAYSLFAYCRPGQRAPERPQISSKFRPFAPPPQLLIKLSRKSGQPQPSRRRVIKPIGPSLT